MPVSIRTTPRIEVRSLSEVERPVINSSLLPAVMPQLMLTLRVPLSLTASLQLSSLESFLLASLMPVSLILTDNESGEISPLTASLIRLYHVGSTIIICIRVCILVSKSCNKCFDESIGSYYYCCKTFVCVDILRINVTI